jgi:hypothetical protein
MAPIDNVVITLVAVLAMNNVDPAVACCGDPEGGVWP